MITGTQNLKWETMLVKWDHFSHNGTIFFFFALVPCLGITVLHVFCVYLVLNDTNTSPPLLNHIKVHLYRMSYSHSYLLCFSTW